MTTRLGAALLVLASCAAQADRLAIPADAPPAFKAECGSCHLPFAPALLSAGDWQKVMANLDRHYGDNASLDDKTRRQIEQFLTGNAGESRRLGNGGGEPPRLTATRRFRAIHHEIGQAVWQDPRVRSPANCVACHPGAAAGSFSEHEVTLPGTTERERHAHHERHENR
jgi:hypothetical protein